MDRREFLGTSFAAAAAAGLSACTGGVVGTSGKLPGTGGTLKLSWFPFELQQKHTFTVSSYSRKTTPDVQVEIEYEGLTGYGEASMPPYLGHTVESVCAFLEKVDFSGFHDPFQLEEIISYVDSLSDGDEPAKAAVDIALHDLFGKLIGQPLAKERLDDIAWITEHSPIPVFADESVQRLGDVSRLKGVFSGINIKLMKCTGLLEARKMITYARAEGMKVMLGCMTETSCACTAADFCDIDGNLLITNDRFDGMRVVDGEMILPDRPGLGLNLIL